MSCATNLKYSQSRSVAQIASVTQPVTLPWEGCWESFPAPNQKPPGASDTHCYEPGQDGVR